MVGEGDLGLPIVSRVSIMFVGGPSITRCDVHVGLGKYTRVLSIKTYKYVQEK